MTDPHLPAPFVTVIAMLYTELGLLPVTGYMAETVDTKPYFQAYGGKAAYHPAMIAKWRYLRDIAPDFMPDYGDIK